MTKLIILTTMVATISFCASAYATERGDVAPDFELPALSGDRLSDDRFVALADYAGRRRTFGGLVDKGTPAGKTATA